MRYVKEVVAPREDISDNDIRYIIIRIDHYGCNFDDITKLVEIAKKDFPNLRDSQIGIVQYGGDRIKRFFGIEFTASPESIPEDYQLIKEIYLTL